MIEIKCKRCGQEFEPPDDKVNICGSCADDLRAEQDAYCEQAKAKAEAEAILKVVE